MTTKGIWGATRLVATALLGTVLAVSTSSIAFADHADFHHHHHHGFRNYVEGTITALGTTSVSLHRDNGQNATFDTTSATVFSFEGLGKTTFADLAVGQDVDVTLTSSAPQTIVKLAVDLRKVEGTVTAISGSTITLNGNPARVVDASSLTTFSLANGTPATLASVIVGDQIDAWGYYAPTQTALSADIVVIHPPSLTTYVEGTITALGTTSVSLHRDNGQNATFDTTSATVFSFEGLGKTTFADLAVGQDVDVTLTSSAPQTIVKLAVDLRKVEGTVTAISGSTITLNGNPARVVDASSLTTFSLANGTPATLASVIVGDQIDAWGYYAPTQTALSADIVVIHPPSLTTYVEGTITALGTTSVSLHRDNGQNATFDTTSATVFSFEGLGKTTFADLAVGQDVDVTLTSSAPQTIVKLAVDLRKVEGTVTAISGSTITLNGNPARVVDASSLTTFSLANGTPATLASVIVGDQIDAWGYYAPTQTALSADIVVIHPPSLTTYVEGTITALGTTSVSLHRDNGQNATFDTTSATVFSFEGLGKTTFADLAVGQDVDVTLTSSAPQTIVKLAVDLRKVEGTVTAISGSTITLNGNPARVVDASSLTTFSLANGTPATLASVIVGDQIDAWGYYAPTQTALSALYVRIGNFL